MLKVEDIENKILNADCLDILRELPDKYVDLVLTDPPYLIKNTNAGGNSKFSKSIQNMNNQIKEANLTNGVSLDFCKEIIRIQDKIKAIINSIVVFEYRADFTYDDSRGHHVVDIKSQATRKLPVFRLKKKILKALYGIDIEVVL